MMRHLAAGIFALVLLATFPSAVSATGGGVEPDVDIRVLAIYDGTGNTTQMRNQMLTLRNAWNTTDLSTDVSVTLVNNGIPVIAPGFVGLGTAVQQLVSATTSVSTLPSLADPLRNFHEADIIVAFGDFQLNNGGPGISACGAAPVGNWTGHPNSSFVSVFEGLDLRDSEDAFVANVFLGFAACDGNTAAHEFGHLLGAGHTDPPIGLYADSKAFLQVTSEWTGVHVRFEFVASVMVTSATLATACAQLPPDPIILLGKCERIAEFSDSDFGAPNGRNNSRALDKTAESVANYRRGDPSPNSQCSDGIDNDGDGNVDGADSDCSGVTDNTEFPAPPGPTPPPACSVTAVPPTSVNGRLTNICTPNPFGVPSTFYQISWFHQCGDLAVDYYEVWYDQPDDGIPPYVFETATTSAFGNFWVNSSDARVKVKSCLFGGGCSALSADSFVAVPRC